MPTRTRPPRSRVYLIEAALAVALIAAPSIWIAVANDAGSGNAAEWVSALATVAAFIAAGYAALHTRRLLQLERERDEQDQANKIALWMTPKSETKASAAMVMRNASDLPVYDAVVIFKLDQLSQPLALQVGIFIPTLEPIRRTLAGPLWGSVSASRKNDMSLVNAHADYVEVEVVFRDASNLWWHRTETSGLLGPFRSRPPIPPLANPD